MSAYFVFPLPAQRRLSLRRRAVVEVETAPSIDRLASSSEILSALEVIRLGLSAGMTIGEALEYSAQNSPPTAAKELEMCLAQFNVGYPLSHGLEQIAALNQSWQTITDTLISSLNSGSAVLGQLNDIESVLQSSLDTEKLKRIKSVAVKSVLPLGVCFLPAFILLAVVPIVAGFISGIAR